MRLMILCFILIQLDLEGNAQSHSYSGLCAYSRNSDAFSWMVQPAVLGFQDEDGVYLLAENRFMLPGLYYMEASLTVTGSLGRFGFQTRTLNSTGQFQWRSGLAYGKQLSQSLSMGVNFDYSQSGNSQYGKSRSLFGGLGMEGRLSEKLAVGFFANTEVALNNRISTDIRVGMGYDISQLVHFSLQIIKDDGLPASVIAGLHYRMDKLIWARAGINSNISGWWMGMGMLLKKFRIDLISNYHPQLGFSPAILFFYSFNKSTN